MKQKKLKQQDNVFRVLRQAGLTPPPASTRDVLSLFFRLLSDFDEFDFINDLDPFQISEIQGVLDTTYQQIKRQVHQQKEKDAVFFLMQTVIIKEKIIHRLFSMIVDSIGEEALTNILVAHLIANPKDNWSFNDIGDWGQFLRNILTIDRIKPPLLEKLITLTGQDARVPWNSIFSLEGLRRLSDANLRRLLETIHPQSTRLINRVILVRITKMAENNIERFYQMLDDPDLDPRIYNHSYIIHILLSELKTDRADRAMERIRRMQSHLFCAKRGIVRGMFRLLADPNITLPVFEFLRIMLTAVIIDNPENFRLAVMEGRVDLSEIYDGLGDDLRKDGFLFLLALYLEATEFCGDPNITNLIDSIRPLGPQSQWLDQNDVTKHADILWREILKHGMPQHKQGIQKRPSQQRLQALDVAPEKELD